MMAVSAVCGRSLQKVWEGLCGKGLWPFVDPWDVVGLRTTASIWNVPKKYGPHGELFFLLQKEQVVLREIADFGYPSGDDPIMCLVWFAHDGRRKCLSVEQQHVS